MKLIMPLMIISIMHCQTFLILGVVFQPEAVFSILWDISLSYVEKLLGGAAATLQAFDAFPPINYLHKTRTSSSPIMQHFSISYQLSFLPHPFIKLNLSLCLFLSLLRSQCSRGSMTWPTRSCWTWFLCSRVWVKRRTFTVCYRAWGTGSRWQL